MTNHIDPLEDGISSIELDAVYGNDIDICNAARVSYGKKISSFTDSDRKLISYLIQHQHTSPFEHNMIRFRVKCPIYVARQWMRHRIGVSYNEISYRYVKAKDEFHIPNIWRYQDTNNKQNSCGEFESKELTKTFRETIEKCVMLYENMIEMGVCREQARTILPVSLYTEFLFTCNLNSLFHFLKLRLKENAQLEIRNFAYHMLILIQDNFSVSVDEWKKLNPLDKSSNMEK